MDNGIGLLPLKNNIILLEEITESGGSNEKVNGGSDWIEYVFGSFC